MGEVKPGFQRFDSKFIDELVFLTENTEHLNKWEQSLLLDRLEAFKTYKLKAVVSVKQRVVIHNLANAIKLLKVEFKEPVPTPEWTDPPPERKETAVQRDRRKRRNEMAIKIFEFKKDLKVLDDFSYPQLMMLAGILGEQHPSMVGNKKALLSHCQDALGEI